MYGKYFCNHLRTELISSYTFNYRCIVQRRLQRYHRLTSIRWKWRIHLSVVEWTNHARLKQPDFRIVHGNYYRFERLYRIKSFHLLCSATSGSDSNSNCRLTITWKWPSFGASNSGRRQQYCKLSGFIR